MVIFGLGWWRRRQCSGQFREATGQLLSSEVQYVTSPGATTGSSSGGYVPRVLFEYKVDGMTFCSRQLFSHAFNYLHGRPEDLNSLFNEFKAERDLRVRYDPNTPWDGYLKDSALLSVLTPSFMGVIFMTIGMLTTLLLGIPAAKQAWINHHLRHSPQVIHHKHAAGIIPTDSQLKPTHHK